VNLAQYAPDVWRPTLEPAPEGMRKRLNPSFVEWLMGYPTDWTGSSVLETP
jgi:hypothetical protein